MSMPNKFMTSPNNKSKLTGENSELARQLEDVEQSSRSTRQKLKHNCNNNWLTPNEQSTKNYVARVQLVSHLLTSEIFREDQSMDICLGSQIRNLTADLDQST